MDHRHVYLICLVFCNCAFGQDNRLAFRPVAAEYSTTLDRLIFISENPNQLHIYNPATNTSVPVNLAQVPLSLSVSPNGLFAAVGHQSTISYVNLTNAVLDRTMNLPNVQGLYSLALGSDWLYVLPTASVIHYSIRLSDGQVMPAARRFRPT